jgi:hypothetical protein
MEIITAGGIGRAIPRQSKTQNHNPESEEKPTSQTTTPTVRAGQKRDPSWSEKVMHFGSIRGND